MVILKWQLSTVKIFCDNVITRRHFIRTTGCFRSFPNLLSNFHRKINSIEAPQSTYLNAALWIPLHLSLMFLTINSSLYICQLCKKAYRLKWQLSNYMSKLKQRKKAMGNIAKFHSWNNSLFLIILWKGAS